MSHDLAAHLKPPFRQARPGDAPILAELVNYAGKRLPLRLWAGMAAEGETAWDVGGDRELLLSQCDRDRA